MGNILVKKKVTLVPFLLLDYFHWQLQMGNVWEKYNQDSRHKKVLATKLVKCHNCKFFFAIVL